MNVPFQFSLPFGSLTGERTRGAAQQFQAPQMVSTWPRTIILGMMFAMVAAVGWVDYAGGLELSVSLLYLVPITIVTWVAGRAMGYTAALASAGVWLAADLLAGHAYGHWIVPLWNTFTLAISFLVVAELLGSLREVNGSLEQIVTRRTRALLDENAQRRRAEEELCDALSNVRKSHAQLRRRWNR
jgi:K+-sensing histidine kinase KdpD